jgi:hypothetical protein
MEIFSEQECNVKRTRKEFSCHFANSVFILGGRGIGRRM